MTTRVNRKRAIEPWFPVRVHVTGRLQPGLQRRDRRRKMFVLPQNLGSPIPKFRQTAQDGVQFAWPNYNKQIGKEASYFALNPGNRADILVQAPMQPGISVFAFGAQPNSPNPGGKTASLNSNVVAYVQVVDGSGNYNKKWPEVEGEYPQMPPFLGDIT
jgi:hypothetical protein